MQPVGALWGWLPYATRVHWWVQYSQWGEGGTMFSMCDEILMGACVLSVPTWCVVVTAAETLYTQLSGQQRHVCPGVRMHVRDCLYDKGAQGALVTLIGRKLICILCSCVVVSSSVMYHNLLTFVFATCPAVAGTVYMDAPVNEWQQLNRLITAEALAEYEYDEDEEDDDEGGDGSKQGGVSADGDNEEDDDDDENDYTEEVNYEDDWEQ